LQINTQTFDSEEQVIQALYLQPELFYQVDINANDFINPIYKDMYEAMLVLYADGIMADIITIRDIKPNLPVLKISQTLSNAITSANIKYHSQKLKEATFNRNCISLITKLETRIGDDDFLKEAETFISELHDIKYRQQYTSNAELIGKIKADIREAKKSLNYGIPTGFPKLNNAIVGLCKRHFIVLGGYTSYGKSTLLSQITKDICKGGYGVLIFSVEDSKQDKITRLIATSTGIPIRDIVRGFADEEVINHAMQDIEKYKLFVYDDVYTLEEMEMKIKKHKMKRQIDIVAIDFIQNILVKGDSIFDRMSRVAIGLQRMAKKHDVCILALSQVSADEKGMIKLRGAQELASSADIVLWMDRDANPKVKDVNLIIRKNRPFGVTGTINMTFNDTWTNIKEVYDERTE